MNALTKTLLTTLAMSLMAVSALAEEAKSIDMNKDFDSLGANEAIVRRARALDPKNKVRIVQQRSVDRDLRLELGVRYGGVATGNTYTNTQNLGGALDFHITPRWSVGGRYERSFNNLTSNGRAAYDAAQAQARTTGGRFNNLPEVVVPVESMMGVLNWYPIYGKTNLFDAGVAQFDFYALGGGGSMKLKNVNDRSFSSAPVYTAGGGMGLWLAQHVSMRMEIRWQTFEEEVSTGSRRMNQTIATAGLGFLL